MRSWNSQKKNCYDLPCYTKPVAQEDFWNRICKAAKRPQWKGDTFMDSWILLLKGDVVMVKILASLTDNPNAPDKNGNTPIHWAAMYGHPEIVKILAPLTLTDNPNGPNNAGYTPIYCAEYYGHTEIVKILAALL